VCAAFVSMIDFAVTMSVLLWSGARQRVQKRKEPKVRQNLLFLQTPFLLPHVNQSLQAGSHPGHLSWFWVSERSVGKCGTCGGRICAPPPIDTADRLYNCDASPSVHHVDAQYVKIIL